MYQQPYMQMQPGGMPAPGMYPSYGRGYVPQPAYGVPQMPGQGMLLAKPLATRRLTMSQTLTAPLSLPTATLPRASLSLPTAPISCSKLNESSYQPARHARHDCSVVFFRLEARWTIPRLSKICVRPFVSLVRAQN